MGTIFRNICAAAALGGLSLLPSEASAQDGVTITADQVDKAVRQIEEIANRGIQDNTVPGLAIAVVFKDKLVYAKGFGVKDTATGAPIDADTVFQLASVSKSIGSTVVAELVGEGNIDWDSRISDLDPAFEMNEPWVTHEITIRDFYAHRSGLPPHAGDLLEDIGFSRDEVLHRLRYQKPNTSFRSGYAYTNFGLTEGSVAAAKAYGLEWEDAAEQKLYAPLGMTSTSSRYADFLARPNRALGHVLVDGKWVAKYKRDPDAQSPAGGVSSSVNDLAKWMRLQLAGGKFDGKQIVNEDALAETHHPQMLTGFNPLNGLPSFYGLGWNVSYDQQGRLRLNHSGAFALGAATLVNLVPSEQLGIVVLTNGYPIGYAEGLGLTFMDLALYGEPKEDWLALMKKIFADPAALGVDVGFDYSKQPASTRPAAANAAYTGRYANDFAGEIEVVEKDGGLAVVEGPNAMSFPMTHYDGDIFTYETTGENAAGASGLIFTLGPDGNATELRVENLDIHGEGVFARTE